MTIHLMYLEKTLMRLLNRLRKEASRLSFKWFSDMQFQGHAIKCHVLLSTD